MEQAHRHATFTFGRFNPPTTGHRKLVDAVIDHAHKHKGDHFIFASHSHDSEKNPLTHSQKTSFMKKLFPHANIHHEGNVKTAIDAVKHLHKKGYTHVTMMVGSDRVHEFHNLLHKYNGKDYHIPHLEVKSAGERDPDAEGVEGMSASKMREAAKHKNFRKFAAGVPRKEHARDLYKAVRKGMKLESLIPNRALFLVGGPGSGKDFVLHSLMGESKILEMPMGRLSTAIDKRTDLPEVATNPAMVVNGNAENLNEIKKIKTVLEAMGYTTGMVYVYTSDEVSKLRNEERVLAGMKTFTEEVRASKYSTSKYHIHKFSEMFNEFFIFDNSTDLAECLQEERDTVQEHLTELGAGLESFFTEGKKILGFDKDALKVPHQVKGPDPRKEPVGIRGYERIKSGGVWVLRPKGDAVKEEVNSHFVDPDLKIGEKVRHYETLHAEPGTVVNKEKVGKLNIYHVKHANGEVHKYHGHQLTRESLDDLFAENVSLRANDNSSGSVNAPATDSPTENPQTIIAKPRRPKKVQGDLQGGVASSYKNTSTPEIAEEKEAPSKEKSQKFRKGKKKTSAPPPNYFDGRMGNVPSGSLGLTANEFVPSGRPLSEVRRNIRAMVNNPDNEES